MSSLVPPQEEKRDLSRTARVPVDHEAWDATPPEFNSASLVPPQEEKRTLDSRFDDKVDRLDKDLSQKKFGVYDEDPLLSKLASDALRSGNAGVTGDDLTINETQQINH